MDIFFQDADEIPLPPEQVRLRDLQVQAHPDGKRVRIYLELDPFQKRPCAELVITNSHGERVADTSIIETMTRKIELTMHLRQAASQDRYRLTATIYYQELPKASAGEAAQIAPPQDDPLIIDQRSVDFETGSASS